jgi:hypothetical protein
MSLPRLVLKARVLWSVVGLPNKRRGYINSPNSADFNVIFAFYYLANKGLYIT